MDTSQLEMLDHLSNELTAAGTPGAEVLARVLWDQANEYELAFGEIATIRLQRCYRNAMRAASGSQARADVALTLSQLMKGKRWADVWSSGAARHYRLDDNEKEVLDTIKRAERRLPDKPGQRHTGERIEEQVLVSPATMGGVEADFMAADDVDSPVLFPLWLHELSQSISSHLMRQASETLLAPLSLRQIADALGQSTLLLDFCVDEREGESSLWIIAVMHDYAMITELPLPPQPLLGRISADGIRLQVSSVAHAVWGVRTTIQEGSPTPQSNELSPMERAVIDGASQLILGSLGKLLSIARDHGKTHLCIVPNGPLHVLPFGALHVDGRPLSEDWTVSVLPTVSMLRNTPPIEMCSRSGLSAFGISYRGEPQGLSELPATIHEAEAIAQAGGGEAVIDEQVTSERFVRALEEARWVHFAGHGEGNAVGPAMHCLYLAPHDRTVPRFFAFELLGRDLRGLELVTLSACETAWSRFDLGDNLQGFASTLLACGAQTVIGTLWEVGDSAAALFFKELYSHLAAGTPRLEAFRMAQLTTRRNFPHPSDWAPFFYLGQW